MGSCNAHAKLQPISTLYPIKLFPSSQELIIVHSIASYKEGRFPHNETFVGFVEFELPTNQVLCLFVFQKALLHKVEVSLPELLIVDSFQSIAYCLTRIFLCLIDGVQIEELNFIASEFNVQWVLLYILISLEFESNGIFSPELSFEVLSWIKQITVRYHI